VPALAAGEPLCAALEVRAHAVDRRRVGRDHRGAGALEQVQRRVAKARVEVLAAADAVDRPGHAPSVGDRLLEPREQRGQLARGPDARAGRAPEVQPAALARLPVDGPRVGDVAIELARSLHPVVGIDGVAALAQRVGDVREQLAEASSIRSTWRAAVRSRSGGQITRFTSRPTPIPIVVSSRRPVTTCVSPL
jgi:hypothetical protein